MSDMSKRTINENDKSKEFKKARGKYFFCEVDSADNVCKGDKSLHNKEKDGEKLKLCIDPNVEIFKMFVDRAKDTSDGGKNSVRWWRGDRCLKEDDEKEGNAVVENPALREAAKEFNDSLLDELQDRLERQARVYDRVVENLLDELDCLRGRIKELEGSLLEKDEVLDDVIEELAAKERQLSAVRGAVGCGVDVKCDEL